MERRFRDKREKLRASGIRVNSMYSDRDTKRPLSSNKDPRVNVISVVSQPVLIRRRKYHPTGRWSWNASSPTPRRTPYLLGSAPRMYSKVRLWRLAGVLLPGLLLQLLEGRKRGLGTGPDGHLFPPPCLPLDGPYPRSLKAGWTRARPGGLQTLASTSPRRGTCQKFWSGFKFGALSMLLEPRWWVHVGLPAPYCCPSFLWVGSSDLKLGLSQRH